MNAIIPKTIDEQINEDRSTHVTIGKEDYELILTLLATKQINKRFGGLDKIADTLSSEDVDFEERIDLICDIIAILANQSIMIHNLWNTEEKKELLDSEKVMLLTKPKDMSMFSNAIMNALINGSKSEVDKTDNKEELKNITAE